MSDNPAAIDPAGEGPVAPQDDLALLRAERDGMVAEVCMSPKDTVAADQVLMTFA